jgi:hypothetical protein
MSVFKVNNNYTVVVNIEAAKLVPELSSLSEEELLYVILAIDNVDGPYRKLPPEERKLLAKRRIYKDQDINLNTPRFELAANGYRGLIFDIRRETVDVFKTKIIKFQKELLVMDQDFRKVKELEGSISFLSQRVTEIEYALDVEEKEEFELKGKKALSQVEIWQRNQRKHKEFKESI